MISNVTHNPVAFKSIACLVPKDKDAEFHSLISGFQTKTKSTVLAKPESDQCFCRDDTSYKVDVTPTYLELALLKGFQMLGLQSIIIPSKENSATLPVNYVDPKIAKILDEIC